MKICLLVENLWKEIMMQYDDFVGLFSLPAVSENRFHFNGKEGQSLFGNPCIDYDARQYDPAIANVFVKSGNYLIELIYCSI